MAGELALGTIFSYTGNANNALGSGNYGNETLLDTTPATNAALAQFGAFIQKKRDDEYKDWHNNTVKAITEAKATDGIYVGDSQAVGASLKATIESMVKDPAAFRGDAFLKNPESFAAQQAVLADHAALVSQSKAFNSLLKNWEKTTSTTSDLNNEVNALQIEQLKKATPEERVTLIEKVHPISDGDKELQVFENSFYKAPENKIISSNPNSVDSGMVDNITTGIYNYDTYLQGFKASKGQYLAKKFELDKSLQNTFGEDVNAYIESEAKNRFGEGKKIIDKVTQKPNEAIKEKGRNDRNAANNEAKLEAARISAQTRKEVAEVSRQAKEEGVYPELSKALSDYVVIDSAMDDEQLDISEMKGVAPEVTSISLSTKYRLNPELKNEIENYKIQIGVDESTDKPIYQNADNLVRVVGKDNLVVYYPATISENQYFLDNKHPYNSSRLRTAMLSAAGRTQRSKFEQAHPEQKNLFSSTEVEKVPSKSKEEVAEPVVPKTKKPSSGLKWK